MHGPINVKSPNNTSQWQMEFNSAFKGLTSVMIFQPVPVVVRSMAWVCGRSPAEIVDLNPVGGMVVCLLSVLCVVRGLCDKLITHPEESYGLWRVVVCDLEIL
jgi:hypothetical protein